MVQERVVYFLGAGFSQPRGLPVMSDFIDKSKELRRVNPEKYGYFADVLSQIADIAIVLNYFEADLHNIEEILSILEMSGELKPQPEEGESPSKSFREYIANVISAYTPEITTSSKLHKVTNWDSYIFGESDVKWNYYGRFVASLHNLIIGAYLERAESHFRCKRAHNAETRYDVISLNYDCVLEKICEFLNAQYQMEYPLRFQRTESDKSATELGLPWLAKLHGSVDSLDDIIPPTWNKALIPESIQEQWKTAYHLLSQADHIRVLGYSLPTSDAYVQYLLKSSLIRAERETFAPIKTFHVITKDSDGKTRRRYEGLVKFRGFQFVDGEIEQYLQCIEPGKEQHGSGAWEFSRQFITLEDAHNQFMQRANSQ